MSDYKTVKQEIEEINRKETEEIAKKEIEEMITNIKKK